MNRLSIREAGSEHPTRVALHTDDGALTFREAAGRAESFLEELNDKRDPDGGLVLFAPELDADSIVVLWALLEGAIPFALTHPRWSARERAAVEDRLRPQLAIRGNSIEVHAESDTSPSPGEIVLFTSGSTGTPDAVPLTHDNFHAAARAHDLALPFEPSDRWALELPLAHVGGLSIVTRCLFARTAVVLDRAVPPTLMSLVPTQLRRHLDSSPPETTRAVLLGGAACPDTLLAEARARGWPVLPSYGMTQTCAQVATQRLEDPRPSGVGPPLDGIEVRIHAGEIQVRAATVSGGDRWLSTGDRGRLDPDGHLHVSGRLDSRIISGGENVDPAEVEAALLAHPQIVAACVVGVPDPEWGQAVAAQVETDLDIAAIERHLDGRLARFKTPKRWRIDPLPIGPNKKIDRRAVRAHFAASGGC